MPRRQPQNPTKERWLQVRVSPGLHQATIRLAKKRGLRGYAELVRELLEAELERDGWTE